ncbi:MAG: thioredoxin [Candidatus Omnitrophica bacterium]|nr:thioredoxin [Candidatus Omnitrophota bacterium]
MSVVHVTDATFKREVLESDKLVLVDFWATWCGPCRMIAPIIDEAAKEFAATVKVCKVDVDECPEAAGRFGVMSIPTLMIFKGGKVMDQAIGALSKQELKKRLEASV